MTPADVILAVCVHRSVNKIAITIPEEQRLESFQYALAPWAIAIVVFLSPITKSIYNFF